MPRTRASDRELPTFRFEDAGAALGATWIAGIDEAGRGPLAGPVVAAAVVLDRAAPIDGLDDSKRLSPRSRERLFDEIRNRAESFGIGIIPPETIDEINILQATRAAMVAAVKDLTRRPDHLLIDGPIQLDLDIVQEPIIKGDRLSVSVAAAGILAKVTRDRIMTRAHEQYPEYGFDRHKGYGTKAHKEALAKYGPTPIHRMTFRGVMDCEIEASHN